MEIIQKFSPRFKYSKILLKQLVKTDFKLRYQGSFLGYLWSLLKPLMLFAIMYLVFVGVLKVNYAVENSGAYLLLGIVLWSFFTEVTGGSIGSIVGKGDLMRKLSFPRYVLVVSPTVSAAINMLINLAIVFIFIVIGGVQFSWYIVFAPLLLIQLFVLALGIGFFLSAIYVKLRDIGYVWDVVTQILFYATPIFFPLTLAPLWAQKILMLNPLAQTIQDIRYVLVSPNTTTINDVFGGNLLVRIIPVTITMFIFIAGGLYFKKHSKNFAEEI